MFLSSSPEARQLQASIGAGYDPVAGSRILAERIAAIGRADIALGQTDTAAARAAAAILTGKAARR